MQKHVSVLAMVNQSLEGFIETSVANNPPTVPMLASQAVKLQMFDGQTYAVLESQLQRIIF